MANLANVTEQQIQPLLNRPGMVPPTGVIPNFDNPPNLRTVGNTTLLLCLALSTKAVCIRVYTTVCVMRRVSLADYAVVLAWALYVGYFAVSWLCTEVAGGVHQWDVRLTHVRSYRYHLYCSAILSGVSIFFIKLSILSQYLQIFVASKKWTAIFIGSHVLIWTNVLFYVLDTFLEVFACSPIRKAWDPLVTHGHCVNSGVLYIALCTLNTISDIGVLILPQITIWRLQMALKQKILISSIFLVGIFACAASAVKLVYSVKVRETQDLTYYTWVMGLWTHPEEACGILAACMPVYPKFFQSLQSLPVLSRFGFSLRACIDPDHGRRPKGTRDDWSPRFTYAGEPSFGRGKPRTQSYEMLSHDERLKSARKVQCDDGAADAGSGGQARRESKDYIVKTVDVELRSDPKPESHGDADANEEVWQGYNTFDTDAMV